MKKIKNLKLNEESLNGLINKSFIVLSLAGTIVLGNAVKELLIDSNIRLVKTEDGYSIVTNYDKDKFLNDFNNLINNKEIDHTLQEFLNNYNVPYKNLIEEYGDYLDKENLIKSIKTLKVQLINSDDEYVKKNNTDIKRVEAYYSKGDNTIKLNVDELSLSDKEKTSRIFSHEFFHFLLRKDHIYLTLLNSFYTYDNLRELGEGFTELLINESFYCEDNIKVKNSYPLNITYARILSELISQEAGIKLGCFSSKKTIKELSKYDKEENIKKMLEEMNQDCLNYFKDIKDLELKKSILTEICLLYKNKYNEEALENNNLAKLIVNIYMEEYMLDFDKNYYIDNTQELEYTYK